MAYETAPFYETQAQGPQGGVAHWAHAEDGVRIRVGGWNAGSKGTAVIFNGRNEFIEKYGRTAADFAKAGYATATLDWRSQGLADRLSDDPMLGYVDNFPDFQKDAAALYAYLEDQGFPKPWHLIGHSMGGLISLRAVQTAHPFASVTFSAPMWAINYGKFAPIATVLAWGGKKLGFEKRFVIGAGPVSYTGATSFEDTGLTNDPEMYKWMQMLVAIPGLDVGGPSYGWVYAAQQEMNAMKPAKSPGIPALLAVGDNDTIVINDVAVARVSNWPDATVLPLSPCKHEPFMESPAVRGTFLREIIKHMDKAEA
ncbi:MAG: alpha/beta hydrolase [Pseudomonadota bacterium]